LFLKKFIFQTLFIIFLNGVLVGCTPEKVNENNFTQPVINFYSTQNTKEILDVNDFIWKGLNEYYYWQSKVELLSDENLVDSKGYSEIIDSNSNSQDFFYSLLNPDDRFSVIYDNYKELQNSLGGVISSTGVEWGVLRACENCNELIGYVKYILTGSIAEEEKKISRGDIFTGVDGNILTASNYLDLLYGSQPFISLNMASIKNGKIVSSPEIVKLKREENFQINPIQISKTIDLTTGDNGSSKKIGYLMYNQFILGMGNDLNSVFEDFKSQNVSDLIIDLRYNGGGSIRNCIELSSMITGQFQNKIFAKEKWNKKLETLIIEEFGTEKIINRFVGSLRDGQQINHLELSRVFVITSSETASASELLINGLTPYIEVIHVGEQTVGKNVGSTTVYDYSEDSTESNFPRSPSGKGLGSVQVSEYTDEEREINPDHTFAMQPIVFKIANAEDFADYSSGLIPDYLIKEDLTRMGTLGSKEEPLLERVLALISGTEKYQPYDGKMKISKNRSVKNPLLLQRQNMFKSEVFFTKKDKSH